MKEFNPDLVLNPSFNSITELTNTTFNPTNYVENRMATEQQISELYNRIVENEIRRDSCCRDIIVWEAHTQIVRMNTNAIDNYGILSSGGVVISDFNENVNIGTMRRGLDYTVTFPIKWDSELYVRRNRESSPANNCGLSTNQSNVTILSYRMIEDDSIEVCNAQSTTQNSARFWLLYPSPGNKTGTPVNPNNNWGSFVYDVKDDGTVTITDHRRNTNFNVIRFYTQWILRRCADDSIIPDPE